MANLIEQAAKAVAPGLFGKKESLVLRIGQTFYSNFESVRVSRDMNTVCSNYQISFADKWRFASEQWELVPGGNVGISIGDKTIINGYIDRLDVGVTNEDRSLTISGRDRSCDLVDCSADTSPNTEFKNQTITDIASNYASLFGLSVSVDSGVDVGKAFEKFTANQGETCFQVIDRAAKLRGLLVISDPNGNLIITNRGGGNIEKPSVTNLVQNFDFSSVIKSGFASEDALIQGQNILTASCSYDETERFSIYVVKGQNIGNDNFFGQGVSQIQGVASDQGVARFRRTTVISETPLDIQGALQRAAWEATVRAGKSVQMSASVRGWFKSSGDLWEVNKIVQVNAGFVGVNGPMLITSVEFTKDIGGGTITNFRLTRPDTFSPKALVDKGPTLGWDEQINPNIKKLRSLVK